jgi:hypothetical protein
VKAHLRTQANTAAVAYRGSVDMFPHTGWILLNGAGHRGGISRIESLPLFESREMFPRQRVSQYVGTTPLDCINVTAIFRPSESESGCGVCLVRQEEEEAVGEMCTVG